MPSPPASGDAGVRAAQCVALPDLGDGAVADEHGAAEQGSGLGGSEHDVAADEEVGHADTLPAGASVPAWTRPPTAQRSPSGRTSSDRSAASPSPARCGWSASSVLGSPGCRSTCIPSIRRRASRAPQLLARYGEGYEARTREMFAAEGLAYAPPPDVVSNTRLALELGEQARAEGLHRAYHDRVMDAYWAESADLSQAPGARGARAERRRLAGRHSARARRTPVGAGGGRLDGPGPARRRNRACPPS